jgi:hypothetical protein
VNKLYRLKEAQKDEEMDTFAKQYIEILEKLAFRSVFGVIFWRLLQMICLPAYYFGL